jgi:predicted enzyme related to lactoylglutathione lyase
MSNPEQDRRIDYIEFPAVETVKTKEFYSTIFGWKFEDYGPTYAAFHDGRLAGGFQAGGLGRASKPLVVIYAVNLEAVEQAVRSAGGSITKAIFSFPGGRRFHFTDPNGNELAVWSEERP